MLNHFEEINDFISYQANKTKDFNSIFISTLKIQIKSFIPSTKMKETLLHLDLHIHVYTETSI